jgi:hypothetical protein
MSIILLFILACFFCKLINSLRAAFIFTGVLLVHQLIVGDYFYPLPNCWLPFISDCSQLICGILISHAAKCKSRDSKLRLVLIGKLINAVIVAKISKVQGRGNAAAVTSSTAVLSNYQ